VATLRYYDQMGLLKPAHVDPFTDYRYYSAEQLPRLNRILALKDLGFSLEQIAQLLKRTIMPDEMRGMLLLRQADAEREVKEAQTRLARVSARLHEIEQEGVASPYDIVIKQVAPQWVISTRQIVGHIDEMGTLCWQLHRELRDWANRQQLKPLPEPAPQLVNLYHSTEYRETDVDVEAVLFVSQTGKRIEAASAGKNAHPFEIRELEGAPMMASGIHQGAMADVLALVKAMLIWIDQNSYAIAGPVRELHLAGRAASAEADQHLVELQIPIVNL
jgi:DNA-binding transcriptional MerR regulator